MSYFKTKRDRNHADIANYLRGYGVEVREMFQPLDLLCFLRGFMGWIEVKMPGSEAKYTRTQLEFIADTRMPVCIAKSGHEAVEFMRDQFGLRQEQKDALAAFLMRTEGKYFTPAKVEEVLNGLFQ